MIEFRDARLTDAVPASLAAQPWAQALAYAEGKLREQILYFAEQSQIYTSLDTCPEEILDALAVCWKVDWYSASYPLQTKRNVIKSSVMVRRYLGTKWATQEALRSIWPDSDIEEWFDYDGKPGCFRVVCNIADPSVTADVETVRNNVMLYKRESAHLDDISFMVRRGIKIGHSVDAWRAKLPECGTLRCGTWWMTSTRGYSAGTGLSLRGHTGAYTAEQPECGTVPETATKGWSALAEIVAEPATEAWSATPEETGIERAGRIPEQATLGQTVKAEIAARPTADAWIPEPFEAGKADSGTLPGPAQKGLSLKLRETAAAAAKAYRTKPVSCGMIRCGTVSEIKDGR